MQEPRRLITITNIIIITIIILGLFHVGGAVASYSTQDICKSLVISIPHRLNFSAPAGHYLGLPQSPTCYGSRFKPQMHTTVWHPASTTLLESSSAIMY